jgi:hypothetical protein
MGVLQAVLAKLLVQYLLDSEVSQKRIVSYQIDSANRLSLDLEKNGERRQTVKLLDSRSSARSVEPWYCSRQKIH